MDKVYQVFVSSTFSDLEIERKQVSDTLAKAGFIPSGMELFPATDQQQLEFIKRIIDRSDYYVVIVAARYGSLDGDKSFTEKEFEYAVSKGIPVLAFIHKEPGKIEADKTDRDPDQIKRLDLFRMRLKTSRIVAFWTDVHDLRTEVLTAVTNAVNLSPGTGWVRGDQAIDPKVLQEMERLRLENTELKSRMSDINSGKLIFPPHLAGPDENFTFDLTEIRYHPAKPPYAERQELSRNERPAVVSIGEMFIAIFETLLRSPIEYSLRQAIGQAVAKLSNYPNSGEETFEVSLQNVEQMRYHLEGLGLIVSSARQSQFSSSIVWDITEKGRRYVTENMGIFRRT